MAETIGVKMRKGNRVVHVDKRRAQVLLSQGYDHIDDNGKIIERATGGRVVNIAEHNQALDKIEKLKQEISNLKGKITKLENENKKKEAPKKK